MGRAWFLWTRREGVSPPGGAGGAGSGQAGAGGGRLTKTESSDEIGVPEGETGAGEVDAAREDGPDEPLHPAARIRAKKSAAKGRANLEAATIEREDTGRACAPGDRAYGRARFARGILVSKAQMLVA